MKLKIRHLAAVFSAGCLLAAPVAKAQVKLSGQMFGDYAYKLQADSALRGSTEYGGKKKDYNDFDIRRIYLNADYDINSKFHVELQLAHEGDVTAGGRRTVYVKVANLRWKTIFAGSDLIMGQQKTPTFATSMGSEEVWGYRSVEKTLLDMRGVASSNDLGIGLQGKYWDKKLGYDLLYGNNLGGSKLPSSPATSASNAKRIYGDVWVKLFNALEIQLYGDYSQYTARNFVTSIADTLGTHGNYKLPNQVLSNMTAKLFVAYSHPWFTVGAEGFQMTQKFAATDNTDKTKLSKRNVMPFGWSAFIRGSILKDKDTSKANRGDVLGYFLRYDSYDPDQNTTHDVVTRTTAPVEAFFVGGLDWQPAKNVHIMPNLWWDGYTSKTRNPAVGKPAYPNGADMVARVTGYIKF